MSLKKDCKATLLAILSKEGMPPIIDKTYGSIWDTFAKTQPNQLTTSTNPAGADSDIWGNLQRTLEKYGVDKKYAAKTVTELKKKYGENPDLPTIKTMMS